MSKMSSNQRHDTRIKLLKIYSRITLFSWRNLNFPFTTNFKIELSDLKNEAVDTLILFFQQIRKVAV